MAIDAFLKFFGPDIAGESTDDKHKDWMEVLSFNWGVTQASSMASGTGGRSAERADFGDFHFNKTIDKASIDLAQGCAAGQHYNKVELQVHEAAAEKHQYYKVLMENVIISSYQPGGSKGADKPNESAAINYGKIQWEYTPLGHDGKPGTKVGPKGWNLETNNKI
jgi:type VI secretion system secreted protein Hcp